ncbi:MAG: hypothetical protein ACFCVE_12745 [Phycisphaerae bacterium]
MPTRNPPARHASDHALDHAADEANPRPDAPADKHDPHNGTHASGTQANGTHANGTHANGTHPVESSGRNGALRPHLCPFCGTPRSDNNAACSRCTMSDTSATRAATKQRIGPWYVLQSRTPSAPGMRFSTLLALVKRGQVTPRSVVRGPTTHQLWTYADRVRGLSREFEVCWHCTGTVESTANACDACGKLQEPPVNPNTLLEAVEKPRGPRTTSAAAASGAAFADAEPPELITDINDLPLDMPEPHVAALPRRPRPIRRPPDRSIAEGDGLLSTSELAAAFRLNLPEAPGRSAGLVGSLVRGVLVVLILAFVAGGAVVAANEAVRNDVFAWVSDRYQSILANTPDWNLGDTKPGNMPTGIQPGDEEPAVNPAGEQSAADADTQDARTADARITPETQPDRPQPELGTPEVKPAPAQAQPDRPQTAPVQTATAEPAAEPTAEPAKPPVITPKPPAKTPPAEIPPAKPATAAADDGDVDLSTLSRGELLSRQRELRNRALDADAAGDWAEAVRLWQQLARMPADIRYTDVNVRLKNAQAMLQRQRSAEAR